FQKFLVILSACLAAREAPTHFEERGFIDVFENLFELDAARDAAPPERRFGERKSGGGGGKNSRGSPSPLLPLSPPIPLSPPPPSHHRASFLCGRMCFRPLHYAQVVNPHLPHEPHPRRKGCAGLPRQNAASAPRRPG